MCSTFRVKNCYHKFTDPSSQADPMLPGSTHSPKYSVMTVNIEKEKRNALLLSRTIDCVYVRQQKVRRWHLHAKIALDQGGNILTRGHMSLKVSRDACERILATNNTFAFTRLHVLLNIISILYNYTLRSSFKGGDPSNSNPLSSNCICGACSSVLLFCRI